MESKVMYKAKAISSYSWIEEGIIIKTTDKSVWIMRGKTSYRELRICNEHAWFESKEEAFKWVENKYLKEIEYSEWKIKSTNRDIELLYEKYEDIARLLRRDEKLNELLGE